MVDLIRLTSFNSYKRSKSTSVGTFLSCVVIAYTMFSFRRLSGSSSAASSFPCIMHISFFFWDFLFYELHKLHLLETILETISKIIPNYYPINIDK